MNNFISRTIVISLGIFLIVIVFICRVFPSKDQIIKNIFSVSITDMNWNKSLATAYRISEGVYLSAYHSVKNAQRVEISWKHIFINSYDMGRDIVLLTDTQKNPLQFPNFWEKRVGDFVKAYVLRSWSVSMITGNILSGSISLGIDLNSQIQSFTPNIISTLPTLMWDSGAPVFTYDSTLLDVVHIGR